MTKKLVWIVEDIETGRKRANWSSARPTGKADE